MQNKYLSVYSRLDRNFMSFLLDTISKGSEVDGDLFNYLIGVGQ